MLPLCADMGVGVIPWSPLARGKLTRPLDVATTRSQTDQFGKAIYAATADQDAAVVSAVLKVAQSRGVPLAQVALAWLLAKPEITAPIIGASKAAQMADAVAALELTLSPEETTMLEAPYVPHAVTGVTFPSRFKGKVTVRA